MSSPRISVIIPVYNGGATLERLCASIAAQTCTDFRVLIIDNASTDNTEDIGRLWVQNDKRFEYVRNPQNKGFAYSYKRGWLASRDFEFMTYISAEDYVAPSYLEKCLKELDSNPQATVAYTYCQIFDDQGIEKSVSKDDFHLEKKDRIERFLTIVNKLDLCTAFYGLIRMSSYIKREGCINAYCAAPDALLLAALAFDGPLVEVPELLIFRHFTGYSHEPLADRYTRLATMSQGEISISAWPFHEFINLNLGVILGSDLDDESKEKIVAITVRALLQRYQALLQEEVKLWINCVLEGKIYSQFSDPSQQQIKQVGQYKAIDSRTLAMQSGMLERCLWLGIAQTIPEFNYARALYYVWQGRRAEAIVALERELDISPTHRHSLDLLSKLKLLNKTEAKGEQS